MNRIITIYVLLEFHYFADYAKIYYTELANLITFKGILLIFYSLKPIKYLYI